MGSTITLSVRTLVLSAMAMAAVLLAYVVGAGQAGTSAAAPAAAPAPAAAAARAAAPAGDTPQIVMTGSGEAVGVPDQLRFSVSVRTAASDVSSALSSANRTTRAVLRAARAQGVAARDVQTTGLNVRATYDYSSTGPPILTGYGVSQNLSVLVRSLPDAGAAIGAVADAGGNAVRLHDVRLQVGDPDRLLREARADAIAEARAKAEQYARDSGAELGDVLLVTEDGPGRQPRLVFQASRDSRAAAGYASDVPIRAGKAELDVAVSVVWSLE